jgi:hypothetical protein
MTLVAILLSNFEVQLLTHTIRLVTVLQINYVDLWLRYHYVSSIVKVFIWQFFLEFYK